MAEILGISDPTYRRYEEDKNIPDIMMLDKMAKALNKNYIDLLPKDCTVQYNYDQKGGVVFPHNIENFNNHSEK